jgi:hypothetical protein
MLNFILNLQSLYRTVMLNFILNLQSLYRAESNTLHQKRVCFIENFIILLVIGLLSSVKLLCYVAKI